VAVLTSATLFLLGIVASFLGNMGWLHLGEDQPWMPLIGLEYGFPFGILIGVIVAVKKTRNPAAGIVELILKPLLMRIPRIQVYADYACAWIVLALGFWEFCGLKFYIRPTRFSMRPSYGYFWPC
jgi:hypothetical protein